MTDNNLESRTDKVTRLLAQRREQLPLTPDVLRAELRAAIAELVDDISARLSHLKAEAAEQRRAPLPDPLRGLAQTLNSRHIANPGSALSAVRETGLPTAPSIGRKTG